MTTTVAILDYGAGNLRSAHRAIERHGVTTLVTHDPREVLAADGLLVPGVGAYAACMEGLKKVQGPRLIGERLAGSRPVLGICVGMQVMFARGVEHGVDAAGLGEWPGTVERLEADVLPHMGWNTVEADAGMRMFDGIDPAERFYFVHSYGVRSWEMQVEEPFLPPKLAWSEHGGDRILAAVENGPLWATQFHPEKSGDSGAELLRNWIATL
ncbi:MULTISPECIES: imidazole glycerol phosphate synthase subunit HisH [Corynebacterium]|uniref:imidazole glycerol phosphate synthase subunit HisH n=1 Tax=Corynebacterium TaxID=1716 RepID=UPI00124F3273|nr:MULTISPECIES: imidazole glycerol phosphate synthase subunit HisH [Corynebacterium]MBV7281612.1 imidazole glycerol phosphate synthase subunit HisH [Corynebacterium sp. TAE3-ERU30]MBV7301252.1 imidazole glycerol phosphate synthase subunit HisH [Corynebacterium sp. TAE3-ERU2]